MYAIVKIGGRQYRAEEGAFIDVDKLPHEVGAQFSTSEVLLVGDGDQTVIGTPTVDGAAVSFTVENQFRDKKVIVFKWHVSTVYRTKRGHRHHMTRLRVGNITR